MFWSTFICILFYGLFVEFSPTASPHATAADNINAQTLMVNHYPMYMDVHVMVFVGFGFLMSFLKNSSWTAIGFTYLIACWSI
jgi:Ammonium Transporter Family